MASEGGRLRHALVGGQIALSTMLLLGTGLLVTNLANALTGDAAATAGRVAIASIELPGRFADPIRGVAARNSVMERVQSLPGVEAVGWASTLPLGRGNRRQFRIESGVAGVTDLVELDSNVVSDGYFRALALPLVEGRLFDAGDVVRAPPVVVVDELLARRYFGKTAAGRHLIDTGGTRVEIVGVVRSGRYRTLQQPPEPTVLLPLDAGLSVAGVSGRADQPRSNRRPRLDCGQRDRRWQRRGAAAGLDTGAVPVRRGGARSPGDHAGWSERSNRAGPGCDWRLWCDGRRRAAAYPGDRPAPGAWRRSCAGGAGGARRGRVGHGGRPADRRNRGARDSPARSSLDLRRPVAGCRDRRRGHRRTRGRAVHCGDRAAPARARVHPSIALRAEQG